MYWEKNLNQLPEHVGDDLERENSSGDPERRIV